MVGRNKYLCDTYFTQKWYCFWTKYIVNTNIFTLQDSGFMLVPWTREHLSLHYDGIISSDLGFPSFWEVTAQWHLGVHDLNSNRKWKYSCMLEIKMHHKTKVYQQHRFFLRIFSQLILTTESWNMGPDITVYYGFWAHVSTKRAGALFSDVVHTSWISHFKAESIGYLNHLAQKSL